MNPDHDPQVIARVRAALDEAAATHTVAVSAPHPPTMSTRRWLAAAACVVLVAGAITALAMNHGDRPSVSPGATSETTGAATSPTTTTAAAAPTMPYFLTAADLAPGPVQEWAHGRDGTSMAIVWSPGGSLGRLLRLRILDTDARPDQATPAATVREVDGVWLIFTSFGLTDSEREELAAQVVAGSGLPWVLPVEGWAMIAMITPADGPNRLQTFGPVILQFGPSMAGELFDIGRETVTAVTVAGQPGLRTVDPSEGFTVVVWREPVSGQWTSLRIPPDMIDRVDALIAAVVPTGDEPPSTAPTPTLWVGEVSPGTAVSSYALAPYDSPTRLRSQP